MILLRNTTRSDLDGIYQLSQKDGIGITTLPNDRLVLAQRLDWSIQSCIKDVSDPGNEYYLFVLEDLESATIIGTSAIEASTGYSLPFYSYHVSKQTRFCPALNLRNDYSILELTNDNQGKSEICTLFLDSKYRGHNYYGKLLSKSRFLFIANNPQRFTTTIIAEMRGIADESGCSPFWESVGQHFFHMSFAHADLLTLTSNKQFISDLMPRYPIYINLLSNAAQNVIGRPHSSARAAMQILLDEGFYPTNYVDIFDAGPVLECHNQAVNTIINSKVVTIKQLSNMITTTDSHNYSIATTGIDFRATIGDVLLDSKQSECIINQDIAEILHVKPTEHLRIFNWSKI
ncbi:MAG: arginine N-succinyltransferase [Legionellales bacterium RIFCSPHIGHO2_12_FULL_42_9]|nr:MAG: arginine N-succinyltransferase [Legionellales bacterium RIFCSPHIGHO2_12_FULL_42_9]